MQLTENQKLQAMAARFYQGLEWTPKAGDLYTTSRADLEVYEVLDVRDGIVLTRYTEGSTSISTWPEDEFQTFGFGPKRVYIPPWIADELRGSRLAENGDAAAVRHYLDRMDDELLARDGSAEITHEEAKQALRDIYLISCGKPPEFHPGRIAGR